MNHVQAGFTATERSFRVEGYEKIEFSLDYVDGAFAPGNAQIAVPRQGDGKAMFTPVLAVGEPV